VRTLLVFPGALGDVLLLAPAARALARETHVEVSVCRALTELAVAVLPCAAGPAVDGAAMSTLFTPTLAPVVAQWVRGAAMVHAWLGCSPASDAMAGRLRMAGARDVRWHAVERGGAGRHASLDYAAALGVAAPLSAPVLTLGGRPAPLAWEAPMPRRLVVHPGAGSPAKRWARDGFRAVADDWRAGGGDVTVLLGPAEEADARFWRGAGHRVAVGLDVMDAAAVVADAPRYLGNDSGISHLAGALGRSGVVLFGPTSAERWRPLGGLLVTRRFDGVPDATLVDEIRRVLARAGGGLA
jgi:hypothetical protein